MRDVHEPSPIVAIQAVQRAVLIGGEHIQAAVAVVVEPHRAHCFARIVDAHILGHLDEAVAFVMKQQVGRVAKGDKQIHAAVVIEIHPGNLPRFALHVDAQIPGDVDEPAVPEIVIQLIGDARFSRESDV